ncbi:MAG: hypothetical protein QF595_13105 [Dehalococcoidia bacterium]|nr:hypothetical protein [Dehalococcoidia bacterium]
MRAAGIEDPHPVITEEQLFTCFLDEYEPRVNNFRQKLYPVLIQSPNSSIVRRLSIPVSG